MTATDNDLEDAAKVLHAVLDATTPTTAARDQRMRRALRQAARALDSGQGCDGAERSIRSVYRRDRAT
jgi:hypothetical protein